MTMRCIVWCDHLVRKTNAISRTTTTCGRYSIACMFQNRDRGLCLPNCVPIAALFDIIRCIWSIRVRVYHWKTRPGANIHWNEARSLYEYVRSVNGTTSYYLIVWTTGLKLLSQAHGVSSTKPVVVLCVWPYISYKRWAQLDLKL